MHCLQKAVNSFFSPSTVTLLCIVLLHLLWILESIISSRELSEGKLPSGSGDRLDVLANGAALPPTIVPPLAGIIGRALQISEVTF